MKFSKVSSAVSSAFNSSKEAVKDAVICSTNVVVSASKSVAHAVVDGATFSIQVMSAVVEFVGRLVWWFVTLPVNLVALLLVYIFAWSISRKMESAANEMRFQNATVVNGEAAQVG